MGKLEIKGKITDKKIDKIKEFLSDISDNQVKIQFRTGTEVKLNEVVEKTTTITQFIDDDAKVLLEIKPDETLEQKEMVIELSIKEVE